MVTLTCSAKLKTLTRTKGRLSLLQEAGVPMGVVAGVDRWV